MEIWKDIYGYEGYYQISNQGNVRRITKDGYRKVKCKIGNYYTVSLCKNCVPTTFNVHRLVALHFVPNPCPSVLNVVNHVDGNKHNNNYQNLEWLTIGQNTLHASVQLKKGPYGQKARPVNMLDIHSNKIIKTFNSVSEASREFPNTHSRLSITFCCQGKYSKACGYKWQYAE